jgi:regulator of sigma E protease
MIIAIFVSVLALSALIFFHELGHYIAAKLTGVHVIEFSVGLGKKLFGWKKNGTEYTIRLFPVGGFCNMLGETPGQESPIETYDGKKFNQKPVTSRIAVVLAGPLTNLLVAVVLFFGIHFFAVGVPQVDSTVVGSVMPDSPAHTAGFKEGDRVVQINEQTMNKWSEVAAMTSSSSDELRFLLERDGEKQVLHTEATEVGVIGVSPVFQKYQLIPSVLMGINNTWSIMTLAFYALCNIIAGDGLSEVSGPVGIAVILGESFLQADYMFSFLIAAISINLAMINLLPLPGLDGSRLAFLSFEAVARKKIDPMKEAVIHGIGIVFLLFLIVLITLQDFVRFVL